VKARKDMVVSVVSPKIGMDTNICQVISDCIHDSFYKNRSVILIATDTVGPVLKKYDDSIRLNKNNLLHVYVPDILLYNVIRAKINLIDTVAMTQRGIAKRQKNILDDKIKHNKKLREEAEDVKINKVINYAVKNFPSLATVKQIPKYKLIFIVIVIIVIICISLPTRLNILSLTLIELPIAVVKSITVGIKQQTVIKLAKPVLTIIGAVTHGILGLWAFSMIIDK
jgi:hypothetical protein